MSSPRFPAIFLKFPPFSLHKLLQFSSASRTNPRISSIISQHEGKSLVYKQKLQFQRPPTIRRADLDWKSRVEGFSRLHNLATFIGTVVYPLKTVNNKSGNYGVYTLLQVESSENRFKILLMMWGEMAEISLKYLKENDFIYVSGRLQSNTKVDEDGHSKIYYKVNVDKFNYVACSHRSQPYQIYEKPEASIFTSDGLEIEKKSERDREHERLHLWQVFLVNPHEWWDNRKTKKNPRAPDFKHKDTGEVLWLDPKDPPWLKRQLQLHDSRMAEQGYQDFGNSRSRVSMWKYDE
ncbi:Protein osb1 [Ranunculus cassubicifolius]